VTVTILDPQIAQVSKDPALAGAQTVTFTNVSTTVVGTVYVQGLALGPTTITAEAPGYATESSAVDVRPSGFTINSPGDFTTTVGAANTNIQITPAMLDPASLNWAANQALRGGLSVDVTVETSNAAVGTLTVSPVGFGGGAASASTAFQPVGVGMTTVSVAPPAGFHTPSNSRQITVTVNPQ
jgi:carbon monoxide dehydrogenase subunit G